MYEQETLPDNGDEDYAEALRRLRQAPIWPLAQRVEAGELPLKEAQRGALKLAQPSDKDIDQQDTDIRALAAYDRGLALTLAELNRQLAQRSKDPRLPGNCDSTLGWLYHRHQKLDLARRYYEAALRMFEIIPDARRSLAQVQLEVGAIQERQGQIDAAETSYRNVLELAQDPAHSKLESTARNRLGHLLLTRGQADKALAEVERALKLSCKGDVAQGIARALKSSCERDAARGIARALSNRGLIYHFLGRLAEAEQEQRQALAISEKLELRGEIGRYLNQLGTVLIARGKPEEAERWLEKALAIARQEGDREAEQLRLSNLGSLYQARAEEAPEQRAKWLAEASRCYQEARAIADSRADERYLAAHLLGEGNACCALGELERAHTCYRQALELVERHQVPDVEWRVRYAWGNLYALQEHDDQAFEHYAAAIEFVERQRDRLEQAAVQSKFWQQKAVLYKQMALCCLRRHDLWLALEYTERAKARYLADLLDPVAGRRGETRKRITELVAGLPPSTAIVVFNVTETGTIIFIATSRRGQQIGEPPGAEWQTSPDGRLHARLLDTMDRHKLQDLLAHPEPPDGIGGYLGDYHVDRPRWLRSTLEQTGLTLYSSLLAVVDQALARLCVERLILMPNLGLALLPLHACPIEGTARPTYLLDRYEISYAPSFGLLRHAQALARSPDRAGHRLLAVATPQKLDWADVEVGALGRLFSQDELVRIIDHTTTPPATPQAVQQLAPEYAYVHFACHGHFDLVEPLRSALQLVEGDLTLEAILSDDPATRLELTDSTRLHLRHTRLVVLGACETAMVQFSDLSDEAISLPSGFLLAGVPTVVATLWKVDDLATCMFMERFYQYHLRGDPDHPQDGPLAPNRSLRRAQIWLRDEVTVEQVRLSASSLRGLKRAQLDSLLRKWQRESRGEQARPFAHPRYWAAFTITGA